MYRPSTISTNIADQLPEHFREEGQDFIEFVKSYYEFLDESNDRQFSKLRDIDTTIEDFLKYYKHKYLKGLPFAEFSTKDIPFLVKNIADLYRSKGTQEALELLFKMFYKTEVETYYPSSSILSLSDSKWAFSSYLEFFPVQDPSAFPIKKGDVIEGDTSKATAFVDEVVFYNINGVQVPVGYISNVYGKFITDDALAVTRNGVVTKLGKLIYGSISATSVTNQDATAENVIGDKLRLVSENTGVDAQAVVSKISDIPTGVIEWELKNGGWGYDVPVNGVVDQHKNTIYKSTQVLVVSGSELDIKPFDMLYATNSAVTDSNGGDPEKRFDGTGMVIEYDHPIIYVDSPEERISLPYNTGAFTVRDSSVATTGAIEEWPDSTVEHPNPTVTLTLDPYDGSANSTITINSMTRYNDSAKFDIDSFNNIENVSFFTDVIADHADTLLNEPNYGMSGRVSPNNIDTPIQDALSFTTVQLGSIESIKVLSTGEGYQNNVRTIVRNEDIVDPVTGEITHSGLVNYEVGSIAVTFDVNDFIISEGDIMEQLIEVEDLTQNPDGTFANPGLAKNYISRARFLRRDSDNVFYFQPLTYFRFSVAPPSGFVPLTPVEGQDHFVISFKGRTLNVTSVTTLAENIAGANADIEGEANYLSGKIEEIQIVNSGFRYKSGETVELIGDDEDNPDKYNQRVGRAVIEVDRSGQTEGDWVTTTSHLTENRYIRDNYYYQEYSYDVSSILDPSVYEKTVKDIVHVAGTKLFGTPLIATVDDVRPDIDASVIQTQTTAELLMREISVVFDVLHFALVRKAEGNLATTGQAPRLNALLDTVGDDGLKIANVTGDPDQELDMVNAFRFFAFKYSPETIDDETKQRVRNLIKFVEQSAFDIETMVYVSSLTNLFDVGPDDPQKIPKAFEIEQDTSDPSAYIDLPVTVFRGQFIQDTKYQILDVGITVFDFENNDVASYAINLGAGHRLLEGDRVRYDDGGTTAITNLSDGVDYFVVEATTETVKLSQTEGGEALQIQSQGTGTGKSLTVIDKSTLNPLSIQDAWNELGGTTSVTYSQGSVLTANNSGFGITTGVAIPQQFVVFLDSDENTLVDFDE